MLDFRGLVVWRKTRQLVLIVYRLTTGFPAHEQFALAVQLRRAAASISANIAEVQALMLLTRDLNHFETTSPKNC